VNAEHVPAIAEAEAPEVVLAVAVAVAGPHVCSKFLIQVL